MQRFQHSASPGDIPRDLYGIPVIPRSSAVPTPASVAPRRTRQDAPGRRGVRTFLIVSVLGGLVLTASAVASAFGII